MYTIATAGHIDHGKSSLVKALTGTDPDRLPEEKEREMTIELGFASFQLSSGEEVGIVDVPGHERFIKNMISGVGALDMVMFVVAADDGWMPQSEEHLAILRYLGLERGMIVLTKVDMVEPDWKEMVKADLRVKTKGTFLDGCEIIEFSAVDQRNLDLVKSIVEDILKSIQRTDAGNSARLYIDRVFTVAGTGTVVTGTLREGTLAVGQEVYHHPSQQKTKVKNLESFYSHLDKAQPGLRLAVGLQALERGHVKRGDLILASPKLQPSAVLGVRLSIEPAQANLAKHNREIILLHGTSEVTGKLFLPDEAVACDDGSLIAVLRLDDEVVVKTGDRFILRLPTPSVLVGGGVVIDPVLQLFKRNAVDRWMLLKGASALDVEAILRYALSSSQIIEESDLNAQSSLLQEEVDRWVQKLTKSGAVVRLGKHLMRKETWDGALQALESSVRQFHQHNQHLASMPLSTLSTEAELDPQLFEYALEHLLQQGTFERHEAGVKVKQYAAGLTKELERARQKVFDMLRENAQQPVNRSEILASDKEGRKLYAYLRQAGEIVDIGGSVYSKETFDRFASDVIGFLKNHGQITVAEARDVTQTSRKVILPLLEELDRQRITKREGDYRVLCE
jgi:selenocysteine-specific elongation factor